MARIRRPMVIKAYMTRWGTPLITEELSNGRIRKIGRIQLFDETWEQEEAWLRTLYGNRWAGILDAGKGG
jgi:hypothetical protein